MLLLVVAVLGVPDREIEKVLTSLRTAFRASLQQNAVARRNVPRYLGFLNSRLTHAEGQITVAIDQESHETIVLLFAEIDALHAEALGIVPDLDPILTCYVDVLTARRKHN